MEIVEIPKKIIDSPLGKKISEQSFDSFKNDKPEKFDVSLKTSDGVFKNLSGLENRNEGTLTEKLTSEEKMKIIDETGWSDEIVDAIGSMEEYEIYREANLVEKEINGKKCLIREDIEWEQEDQMGRTNKERAEQGLSPIDENGKAIELHHIGQETDSPLAELTLEEHRGKGNDGVLHDKTKETEINRNDFAVDKNAHWKERAGEGDNQNG